MNELLLPLLVTGSLGALVGLERQWESQVEQPGKEVVAGVRTFTFWGILGGVCAFLSQHGQAHIFLVGMMAVAGWLGVYLYFAGREQPGAGFTTAAMGMLTYLMGGLVMAGEARVALVVTVVCILLLAGKPTLHRMSRNFTGEDARMALQFLAVTGVVLPLVPDQDMGPMGAFNPRSVWLMVVMVSGLGFVGYIAVRMLGTSRGIALTGLAGGLASSTATTLSMSRLSKERPELAKDCTMALLIACTIMLWRVELLVAAVSAELAVQLVWVFGAMSLPGVVYAGWHFYSARGDVGGAGEYKNPLSLKVALQFGVLYAVVVLVVKYAAVWFGGAGILVVSFFSGLTDLDAIALSLSNFFRDAQIGGGIAAQGIVLAAVANSLMKGGLAISLGAPALRVLTVWVLGATSVIGVVAIFFL